MAVIGDLVVRMGVDAKGVRAGVTSSIGQIASVATIATAVGKTVDMAMDAIGSAIDAMQQRVSDAFSRMDEVGKTSDQLGIATEAFVGLTHAAKLSGVETNELLTALRKMGLRASEAAAGGGEALKIFQELGLDADKLVSLPIDQQFLAVADAMGRIDNQSDRVRLSMKLFEESGSKFLSMFSQGSVGIRRMQVDAERLGLTFSRMDAAGVENANDAAARFEASIDGIAQTLATELAPALETVANILADDIVPLARSFWEFMQKSADVTTGAMFRMAGAIGGNDYLAQADIGTLLSDIASNRRETRDIENTIAATGARVVEQMFDQQGNLIGEGFRMPVQEAAARLDSSIQNLESTFDGFNLERSHLMERAEEIPRAIEDGFHDIDLSMDRPDIGAGRGTFEGLNSLVQAQNRLRTPRVDMQQQVVNGVNRVAGLLREQNNILRGGTVGAFA